MELYELILKEVKLAWVRDINVSLSRFSFLALYPCVYDTLGQEADYMRETLQSLESHRAELVQQIAQLRDLRSGSVTPTTGRCGKPNCHCHQPNHPGHGPHLRLTYKVEGCTVTESLSDRAELQKVQREIAEFRKFQQLVREFIEVNAKICRLREVGTQPQEEPRAEEKKRRKRFTGRSPKK